MRRVFNTAGACNPKHHYMIPAETLIPEAPFTDQALEQVWQLAQGQPWLTNALGAHDRGPRPRRWRSGRGSKRRGRIPEGR